MNYRSVMLLGCLAGTFALIQTGSTLGFSRVWGAATKTREVPPEAVTTPRSAGFAEFTSLSLLGNAGMSFEFYEPAAWSLAGAGGVGDPAGYGFASAYSYSQTADGASANASGRSWQNGASSGGSGGISSRMMGFGGGGGFGNGVAYGGGRLGAAGGIQLSRNDNAGGQNPQGLHGKMPAGPEMLEGSPAAASLNRGQIPTTPVPDSGSGLVLFGLSLAGLALMHRQTRVVLCGMGSEIRINARE